MNGRPVENKGVLRTLKRVFTQACKSSSDKFPVCAVAIKVKPKDLDVNLDPNKHTVLMKQQAELNDKLETTLTHFYKLDEDDVPDNMSDTSLMEGPLLDKSAGVTYDLYSETESSSACWEIWRRWWTIFRWLRTRASSSGASNGLVM